MIKAKACYKALKNFQHLFVLDPEKTLPISTYEINPEVLAGPGKRFRR